MAEKSVSTDSFATQTKRQHTGRKLRVAIIGCGGISELHIAALRDMPEVEIIAGVDIKQERLDVMRDKFKIPELYEDWKKMLKQQRPDAVTICTPNGMHAAPAIDAANAGCH